MKCPDCEELKDLAKGKCEYHADKDDWYYDEDDVRTPD